MELSFQELIGFITGVTGVVMTIRQIIWSWLVGLLNVLIYLYVFYTSRLYSDMALQLVYVVLSLYGWYQWKYGAEDTKHTLRISRWSSRDIGYGGVWMIVCTCIQYWILKTYTNADYPFWDATLTSASLWATYLMAKKKVECWLLWVVTDAGYIGLYEMKALYLTMALYAVYVILAARGWSDWSKEYRKQEV